MNNLFDSERLEAFVVDQLSRRGHELLPHDRVWGTKPSPSSSRLLNHLNLCQITPISLLNETSFAERQRIYFHSG
jgi:hypothetical protein